MSLQQNLITVHKNIQRNIPTYSDLFDADTEVLVGEGVGMDGPKVGDIAPDFELPDALGRNVRSQDLRANGPLVINFYRGNWCPYCNLELRTLQLHLPQITTLGASLVAISPQIPDQSLTTAEKNELAFPVLSDVGNVVARRFGLVFALAEHLRPIYTELGIDLPKFNGTNTFELPVPGTFIIDRNAVIQAVHVNADYKKRMEPARILEVLMDLRSHNA